MDTKKLIKLISLIAALIGGGVGYDIYTGDSSEEPQPAIEAPAELPSAKPESADPAPVVIKPSSAEAEEAKPLPKKIVVKSERKRCVFASFRDGDWVTGWGRVKKTLPDDTYPPCHQRFLLVDPTGETLLIAHNIDKWARLDGLHPGDIVEFKGEFKDTENGYLVHWTHPDPAGRKPGGYIRKGK